jgi:site-specific DNA-methyltransferase (adenine-specific)
MNRIECCDVFKFTNSLEDNSIDLIITDLPYESLEKYRKIGTKTRLKQSKASNNKWFEIFPNSKFEDLFKELFRVMKPNSHLYMFSDSETSFIMKPIGEKVGFKFWKPIIWEKMGGIGMGYHYRAKYEMILFFEKGKRKLNDLSIPDIIKAPRVYNKYPTEKPVELMEIFIKNSSNEGEIVLDPFMGACPVGEAAIKNNRIFFGCDSSKEAYEISKERIKAYEKR